MTLTHTHNDQTLRKGCTIFLTQYFAGERTQMYLHFSFLGVGVLAVCLGRQGFKLKQCKQFEIQVYIARFF